MKGSMTTDLGVITIEPEVVAKYAGTVAVECFGIVGMAAVSMKDGLVKLLKRDYLTHGINVTVDENNKNYKVNNNLLTSLDSLTIYLAANGFNYNEYIIPEGYEYIAEGAFSGISSLTKLTIST